MKFEQMLQTTFPDIKDREDFVNCCNEIIRNKRKVYYWYGTGNNGKSTIFHIANKKLGLINYKPEYPALSPPDFVKDFWFEPNEPIPEEGIERLRHLKRNVIIISNLPPPENTIASVVHFRTTFSDHLHDLDFERLSNEFASMTPTNPPCCDPCFICHGRGRINADVICGECRLPQNSHASPDNLDTCDLCHRRWHFAVGGCGGTYQYTDALSISRRTNAINSPTTSVDSERSLYGPDFSNSRIR